MRILRPTSAALVLLCLGLALGVATAAAKSTDAEVQAGLEKLTEAPGGPPGAIATLYRNGKLTTLSIMASRAKTKPMLIPTRIIWCPAGVNSTALAKTSAVTVRGMAGATVAS